MAGRAKVKYNSIGSKSAFFSLAWQNRLGDSCILRTVLKNVKHALRGDIIGSKSFVY